MNLSRFLNFACYLSLGLGHAATRKSVRIFSSHKDTTAFENLVSRLVPSTQYRKFLFYWSICVQIMLIEIGRKNNIFKYFLRFFFKVCRKCPIMLCKKHAVGGQ